MLAIAPLDIYVLVRHVQQKIEKKNTPTYDCTAQLSHREIEMKLSDAKISWELGVGDSDIYVYDQIIITWFQSSVDKQARD
jgi:hypothetical protein